MKSIFLLTFLGTTLCIGCHSSSKDESIEQTETQKSPNTETQPPIPNGETPSDQDLSFEHVTLIRELDAKEAGALFGFKPSSGAVEITKIAGPAFLNGHRKSLGLITSESVRQLFAQGGISMSEVDRDKFRDQYNGYNYVYFENYDGDLCAGDDNFREIVISTKTSTGRQYELRFRFEGNRQQNGSCKLHNDLFLSTNIHAGR